MNKIFKFILDLIFPIYCVNCNKEGEWICSNCLNKYEIEIKEKKNLQELTYVDSIFYFFDFNDKNISKLIHFLKYDYAYDVARFIGNLVCDDFVKFKLNYNNVIFIPVPLHKKRFDERGFNQSIVILENLKNKIRNIGITDLLKRVKNTEHQASLSGLERSGNLKNAFIFDGKFNLKDYLDCDIILFDDVVTTGNTFDECAKVLRDVGFKNKIIGLSIAGQD